MVEQRSLISELENWTSSELIHINTLEANECEITCLENSGLLISWINSWICEYFRVALLIVY
jgi:hypothetical protein